MLFIFLFFAALSVANQMSCAPYALEIKDLIHCLEQIDANHDERLDGIEITNFLEHFNMTQMINATIVLDACDLDHDGELSFIEFNSTNSCVERRLPRLLACMYCNELLMQNNNNSTNSTN